MASTSPSDMWHYREGAAPIEDIAGFSIEAKDGGIGRVDKANAETGSAYLIVATGPWIFGRTVMLPAGVIERIDYKAKVAFPKPPPHAGTTSARREIFAHPGGSMPPAGGCGVALRW